MNAPAKGGSGGNGTVIIIKKKGGHGGHHGGAWKVAYADFVTAMMALFMVLWLVSQTDQVDRKVISHYFRTGVFPEGGVSLIEMGEGIQDGTTGLTDREKVIEARTEQEDLQKAAKNVKALIFGQVKLGPIAKNVKVRTIDRGLLIEILDGGDDLLFDLSSSALKPKLVELLTAMAPALDSLRNPVEIHGHTDARPFPKGAQKDNWSLSFERAAAARDVLEQAGVSASRFAGVFAHGSMDLFKTEDPFHISNRRISILAVRMVGRRAGGLSSAPEIAKEAFDQISDKESKNTTPSTTAPKGHEKSEGKEALGPRKIEPIGLASATQEDVHEHEARARPDHGSPDHTPGH